MYKHLENRMRKELEALEEKYRTGAEMSEGDLRRADLLAHTLKSLATYCAMKEAEEYESDMNRNYSNNSMARGNRYMSRDMDMSGRYPYPVYPEERRW